MYIFNLCLFPRIGVTLICQSLTVQVGEKGQKQKNTNKNIMLQNIIQN